MKRLPPEIIANILGIHRKNIRKMVTRKKYDLHQELKRKVMRTTETDKGLSGWYWGDVAISWLCHDVKDKWYRNIVLVFPDKKTKRILFPFASYQDKKMLTTTYFDMDDSVKLYDCDVTSYSNFKEFV